MPLPHTGAGILPFVNDVAIPYVILFRSRTKDGYEDLGGGIERREITKHGFPRVLKITAIREAKEESCGTVNPDITTPMLYYDYTYGDKTSNYRTYLFPMKKHEFSRPEYYTARDRYKSDPNVTSYWKETVDVQYFGLDELYKAYKSEAVKCHSMHGRLCDLTPRTIAVLRELFR